MPVFLFYVGAEAGRGSPGRLPLTHLLPIQPSYCGLLSTRCWTVSTHHCGIYGWKTCATTCDFFALAILWISWLVICNRLIIFPEHVQPSELRLTLPPSLLHVCRQTKYLCGSTCVTLTWASISASISLYCAQATPSTVPNAWAFLNPTHSPEQPNMFL